MNTYLKLFNLPIAQSLLLLCLLIFSHSSLGQENNEVELIGPGDGKGISAIHKKSNKNIIIRWAPNDEGVWLKSLEGIVRIERTHFESFAERDESNTVLLTDSLRPWSVAKLEREMIAHPHRKDYIMAGALLYGEWESIDSSRQEINMQDIANRYDELVNRYSQAILLADISKDGAEAMGLRWVDSDMPTSAYISYRITLILPDGTYYQTSTLYSRDMNMTAIPRIEDSEELDGAIRISWERKGHDQFFSAYFIEQSADGKVWNRLNQLPFINAVDAKESFGTTPISYRAEVENDIPYYYRIIGLDPFGEESTPSQPVLLKARDLTPPPAPKEGLAKWIESGHMEIRWQQDSFPEDFRGFLVLKSDSFEEGFEPISDTLSADDQIFQDTGILSLGKNYYKVCALDFSGNQSCTPSIFGIMADTIPPLSPMELKGEIDSTGIVQLSWSPNQEEDLEGYYVYFSNGPDNIYHRLNTQPIRQNKWQDTLSIGTLTKDIYYKITAADKRANVSDFSQSIKLIKPDTIPPAPALLERYEIDSIGITIYWINSNSRDVTKHQLLRKTVDSDWGLIAEYAALTTSFTDKDVKPGHTYEYSISAIDEANLRSKPTRTFKLNYPYRTLKMQLDMELNMAENGITITLIPGVPSEELESIWVYKKKEGAQRYQKIAVIRDQQLRKLQDTEVANKSHYTYKYRVEYKNGLKSDYSPEFPILFQINEH